MRTAQKPVSDAEVAVAFAMLERYPNGITKQQLIQAFGGSGDDRRGRHVLGELARRGMAAIINVPNPYGEGTLYKIAQPGRDDEAFRQEIRSLRSRQREIQARIEGLERAFERGAGRDQGVLF